VDGSSRHVIELKACGPEDPDARRAASVLAAYFNVEQAQAFRRLLWRQAAAAAVVACTIEATTSLLPRRGFFIAIVTLVVAAAAAAIAEHRASRALRALL
jgi:hypothetical protein